MAAPARRLLPTRCRFGTPRSGHFASSCTIFIPRKEPGLAKEELLTMEGTIDEMLPDGRFRVILDNEHTLVAYTAGKMRKFRIRSVAGDRVHVEMTPYDLTKGRIVFRERSPGQGGPPKRRAGFRR